MTDLSTTAAARSATLSEYSDADALALIRLRYWQHLLNEMLKAGRFNIPVHLAFGHEAAAIAMDKTMQAHDALCLTHRNGAYNLARSKSFASELAHYRLEAGGPGAAQMGSMNLAMAGTNILYSSSILGNNVAVASGVAMNRKLTRRPGVVFVLSGDGAIEEGAFWESLIFAKTHGLSLVIVVENNDYSLGSTIAQRRCGLDLSLICAGIGVGYRQGSGARLPNVAKLLGAARADAEGGCPQVVELAIMTFNQHAGATPGWPEDPKRIALEDGLLLGGHASDPLDDLYHAIGREEFDRLADVVRRETPADA